MYYHLFMLTLMIFPRSSIYELIFSNKTKTNSKVSATNKKKWSDARQNSATLCHRNQKGPELREGPTYLSSRIGARLEVTYDCRRDLLASRGPTDGTLLALSDVYNEVL